MHAVEARPFAQQVEVRRTVEMLDRRGFAVTPARLAGLCLGGPISVDAVLRAVAADPELRVAAGLVVRASSAGRAERIRTRARRHGADAPRYLAITSRFVSTLVAAAPFIRSVAIAGSLATGGFCETDDVDLNLIVEDGYRHLAYVAVNVLGLAHAMRYRDKPVDGLTRRPLAPRLMTVNLVLERSDCRPLRRQDADMAFELFVSEPLFGADELRAVVAANPALLEHLPQLATRQTPLLVPAPARRLPRRLFPRILDHPSRVLGEAAWRYMQWTRRRDPEALARVAFVRSTMRPYTLFDRDRP